MLDSFEIESLLIRAGFRLVEEKTHAIGFAHPALGGQRLYLKDGRTRRSEPRKAVRKQPLVMHPDVGALPGFEDSRAGQLLPNHAYMNGNMSDFPARNGSSSAGIAVDIENADALQELLGVMGLGPHAALDGDALAFLDGFLASDNPQFVYWLPNYRTTLARVADALSRNAPEELFELIWKSQDNAVSKAGQGVMGFETADRLRGKLVEVTRDIAADGSPASFDAIISRFEQWRAQGELSSVPRLLAARAFAAIHPDRYHTTVDAAKQDRIFPWFAEHTGFVVPVGNWAAKAEALTAHLGHSGVFDGDRELRNMFPWFVFQQMRGADGKVAFRPGHISRAAAGEAESLAQRRTINYRQNVIQNRLVELLREEHGHDAVATEHPTGTGGFADALVQHGDGSRELYEIKPAGSAREAVRQALGQLLEYAYRRNGLQPKALHVVSDAPMDAVTGEYLEALEVRFGLRFGYMQVESGKSGETTDE